MKMGTQDVPEFPSSHRCTKYRATHTTVSSGRNPEITRVTPTHRATKKIPTSNLVGKAETHAHHHPPPRHGTLKLGGREPQLPASPWGVAGVDHTYSTPAFKAATLGTGSKSPAVRAMRACDHDSQGTVTKEAVSLKWAHVHYPHLSPSPATVTLGAKLQSPSFFPRGSLTERSPSFFPEGLASNPPTLGSRLGGTCEPGPTGRQLPLLLPVAPSSNNSVTSVPWEELAHTSSIPTLTSTTREMGPNHPALRANGACTPEPHSAMAIKGTVFKQTCKYSIQLYTWAQYRRRKNTRLPVSP